MNIVLLGAGSAIAEACARHWAAQQNPAHRFFLVARHAGRLQRLAEDLRARGADAVFLYLLDLDHVAAHAAMQACARAALGRIDLILIASAVLPDAARGRADPVYAAQVFHTNATAVIAAATAWATVLENQQHGTLALIGSLAGLRGRASNYLYGSSKAALLVFCEGLRTCLRPHGIQVLTILPGYVATPMTATLALPGWLLASPGRVACDIDRAIRQRQAVCYTPGFWRMVSWLLRLLPSTFLR